MLFCVVVVVIVIVDPIVVVTSLRLETRGGLSLILSRKSSAQYEHGYTRLKMSKKALMQHSRGTKNENDISISIENTVSPHYRTVSIRILIIERITNTS